MFILRILFYTNYLRKIVTNSLENSMKNFDGNLFTVYGKPDNSMTSLSNEAYGFKMRLYNSYSNSKNPPMSIISNVISYSQSDNEKILNYAKIIEDRYSARDTNTAYNLSEEGYKFFAQSYSNISDSNAYRFVKAILPIYRRMGEDGAIKGANRALHFMSLYTNENYDLIDEYFTPRTLSRFLKSTNNLKSNLNDSIRYLNYIASRADGEYKNKILEIAVLYNLIYAKSSTNDITNFINAMTNANDIINIANTISDSKATNQTNIFNAMNYIYANQYIFENSTASAFADRFYLLYKTNASYIYGLLNKIRVPESDFEENIETASEIFSNENTNTMFIFYSYENSKYIAYSYIVGDREVKKSELIDREKLNGFLTAFTNISKAQDRIRALKSIENGMLSSAMIKDVSKVDTVYITGSYANLFTVPFAYLDAFKNANVIKIRELKYSSEDILNLGNVKVELETQTNFYNSLETLAVQSAKTDSKRNIPATHYIGISTNDKPFDSEDIFLSPASNIDIFRYLRGRNETKLMFTYSADSSGDYYTSMKYLYGNFDKGIIEAYVYIKNNRVDFNAINPSDENTLYTASYTLFDYILPSIPKYRKN